MVARLRCLQILILAVATVSPTSSQAMNFMVQNGVVVAEGEIGKGDSARFQAFVGTIKPRPSLVSIASNGGNLAEGMALA